MRSAVVVGRQRLVAGTVGRGSPSVLVDAVVVGDGVARAVHYTRVPVVGGDVPCKGGLADVGVEAQVLGGAVHAVAAE